MPGSSPLRAADRTRSKLTVLARYPSVSTLARFSECTCWRMASPSSAAEAIAKLRPRMPSVENMAGDAFFGGWWRARWVPGEATDSWFHNSLVRRHGESGKHEFRDVLAGRSV